MLKELPENHDIGHLHEALELYRRMGGVFDFALDGGAHQGIWTRELLKHFKQVIAIEPVLSNFDHLPILDNKCTCINAALGNQTNPCTMKPGTENTGQYHVTNGGDTNMIKIDNLALGINFMKLDVEGYELHVLKGALETIRDNRPAIMIEMNGLSNRYGYTDADLNAFLISLGYYRIKQWNKDHLYVPE